MNFIIVALCIAALQSGDFVCIDTQFDSPSVIDCTDLPTDLPFGASERGSGWLAAGNVVNGVFEPNIEFTYAWSGRQIISGPFVRGVYGVDEDVIFADSIRHCQFIEDVADSSEGSL